MKALLFVLLLLGGVTGSIQAQNAPFPISPKLSTTLEQTAPDVDPRFAVTEMMLLESSLGRAAPFNQTDLRPAGNNVAQIIQIGDQNLTVLRQYGVQNIASIRQEGSDNRIEALQNGTGNRLGITVLGSANYIPVMQSGLQNELALELYNTNGLRLPPGTAIEQTSRGLGIPLRITLTPGQRGN